MVIRQVEASKGVYKIGDLTPRFCIALILLSNCLCSLHQPPVLLHLEECQVLHMCGFKASHNKDW